MEGFLKDQHQHFFFLKMAFHGRERFQDIPRNCHSWDKNNVFEGEICKKNCNKRFGFVYARVYLYF